MKGLLVKDFQIILQQKRTLMLMVIISILMMFAIGDISFVTGYVTLMASFTAIGTISYDEIDNGYSFMFTLPIDKKGYVLSKFIVSIVAGVFAWGIVNGVMAVAMEGEYGIADFIAAASILAVILIMQFVMIPLQLKYGAEKSRIVYLLMAGGIVLLGFLLGQFGGYLPDMTGVLEWIVGLGTVGIVGMVVLVVALIALISFLISCRIMNKKQF